MFKSEDSIKLHSGPHQGLPILILAYLIVGVVCISVLGFPFESYAQAGKSVEFTWSLSNPFKSGSTNPQTIILEIINWILNIGTALIVILIIYAGIRFMLAAGRPGEISRAKNILFWALIGFVVILIGKGFISLIISVLEGDIPTFI